jgi:thiol-disulfide isomerase/thioredoxin
MNLKSIFFSVSFLVGTFLVNAQVTTIRASIAPDFTMVSMDGDTFNLYTELNAGKIVVLDFFATACPSCQQNTPKLDSVWQAYGCGGDSLWVWGIECSFGDSNYVQHINDFETNYGGQFPIFSTFQNTDSVLTLYGITWTPQYYLICPDTKTKQPRMEITEVDSVIQACQQILTSVTGLQKDESPTIFYAAGQLHISGLQNRKSLLEIFSPAGKLIFQQQIETGNKTSVSLPNNLPEGIYFVRLCNNRIVFSSKYFFAK